MSRISLFITEIIVTIAQFHIDIHMFDAINHGDSL